MADNKKYYKLDEIRIIGKQNAKSAASNQYHTRKTGDIFREARAAASRTVAASKIRKPS